MVTNSRLELMLKNISFNILCMSIVDVNFYYFKVYQYMFSSCLRTMYHLPEPARRLSALVKLG